MSRSASRRSKVADPLAAARARAVAIACGLFAAGCARGCQRDRPYTPYTMADGPSANPTSTAPLATATLPLAAPADAGGFVHVIGQAPELGAPGGALRADGTNLIAPPSGERFALGLTADVDGDGSRDVVAWSVADDPLAGRLLFYSGAAGPGATPRQLASLAGTTIGQPDCAPEVGLEQIGPHSVAVSVRAACAAPPAAPDATQRRRWIAVASPRSEPPLRQELTVSEPPPGEQFGVELDASDVDGDQRDDLLVRIAIAGAAPPFEPGPRAIADLRWLDRSTGLSRDPNEPESSLAREATLQLARATKKAQAAEVAAATRQVARLYAWICSDAGAPLLNVSSGAIRCGNSRALDDAIVAGGRAALTLGDVPRAIAAYERALARASGSPSARVRELEKSITRAAPTRLPAVTRVFATVPDVAPAGVPAWGPLTFTPGGDLLVRTATGLSIANVQTGVESQSPSIPSWPAAVTSPDGATRWLGLYDPCDNVALRARFGTVTMSPFVLPPPGELPPGVRDVALPAVPAIPPRCAAGAATAHPGAVPITWGGAGLEAWVGGEPVLIGSDLAGAQPLPAPAGVGGPSQPVHAGSPRSPDGQALALATKLGVLVRSGAGWQLWRPADLQGAHAYANLRACTIANAARAVACVRDGRLIGMLAP